MKAIFPFAVFANDKAGLVVADLDNVRFGHGSCLAGTVAGILLTIGFDG